MNDNLLKFKFEAGNNQKYNIKNIKNNMVYTKKTGRKYISRLYSLAL